jgi:excisionase family DNA binding protein
METTSPSLRDRQPDRAAQLPPTSIREPFFGRARRRRDAARTDGTRELPVFLSVDEAANLLRTTRKAVYAMLERGQLPSPFRVGRRLLLRQDELLDWLDQKRAPSLKE